MNLPRVQINKCAFYEFPPLLLKERELLIRTELQIFKAPLVTSSSPTLTLQQFSLRYNGVKTHPFMRPSSPALPVTQEEHSERELQDKQTHVENSSESFPPTEENTLKCPLVSIRTHLFSLFLYQQKVIEKMSMRVNNKPGMTEKLRQNIHKPNSQSLSHGILYHVRLLILKIRVLYIH